MFRTTLEKCRKRADKVCHRSQAKKKEDFHYEMASKIENLIKKEKEINDLNQRLENCSNNKSKKQ